jgi:hypothetical protein
MLVAFHAIYAVRGFMLAFRASEQVVAGEFGCSVTEIAKQLQHCLATIAGDDEVPFSGFKHRKHEAYLLRSGKFYWWREEDIVYTSQSPKSKEIPKSIDSVRCSSVQKVQGPKSKPDVTTGQRLLTTDY